MSDAQVESSAMNALTDFRREMRAVPSSGIDLVDAERRVQALTNALACEVMKEVMLRADAAEPEVIINGEVWGNRRTFRASYVTMFGELEIERGVYQRSGRGRVAVPLDLRLSIVEGSYTPRVARVMARAVGLMTSEEAEGLLEEVGVAKVSVSTLHRIPRAMAARYEKRRCEIEPAVRQSDPIPSETATIQVGIDGAMVPQDGEHARPRGRKTKSPEPPRHEQRYGSSSVKATAQDDHIDGRAWHEAGVGTIAYYDLQGNRLKTTYLGQMPEADKASLVALLNEEVQAVVAELPGVNICFASDGALPQWTALQTIEAALPADFTGHTMYLLDLFHAAEHLQKAANAIYGEGSAAQKANARVASENWKTTLETHDDGAQRVLKSLRYQRDTLGLPPGRQKKLKQVIKYIARHRSAGRVDYAEARRRNYPVGTGVTEAAAKTLIGVRMKRAGARYSQHGGQTIFLFRGAILSRRFHLLARRLEDTYAANVVTSRVAA